MVKAEQPNSHVKFVSSDSNGTEDAEDTSCILNDKRGLPLLTESSLLRTMDAIQSAQTKSREQSNAAAKTVLPASNKSDLIESVTDDCLFVIDRVGEEADEEKKDDSAPGWEDTKAQPSDTQTGNTYSISKLQSNRSQSSKQETKLKSKKNNAPKGDEADEGKKDNSANLEDAKALSSNAQTRNSNASSELQSNRSQSSKQDAKFKSKKNNTPKESFEFVIDRDGVRELGGEIDDLPISSNNAHNTSAAANAQNKSADAAIKTHTTFINKDLM